MKRFGGSVLLLLVLLAAAPIALAQNPSVHKITILHLNDLHGHILPYIDKNVTENTPASGSATLSEMIEEERTANPDGTLLLAAGDMFQGTPLSNIFKGKPVIEVMNYLKFDAMALGNHEFDWGRENLGNLINTANFPFLSGNIRESGGTSLPGVHPYVILTRKGLKIAIVGATTPETVYATKPNNIAGLAFSDPLEVLPGLVRDVKDQGADLVILLSHLGLDADKHVAQRVPGIDVIVGGHSHTVVTDPLQVGSTIIVQAGYYGLYLGVLKLEIDKATHKILDYNKEHELKPVFSGTDNPRDEKVAQMVGKYNEMIETEFSKVVGETTVDLTRDPVAESNIGDLLCDAMREATGADIVLQHGGGIRADLLRGKIRLNEVYTVLPFDNFLVLMNLSGDQILRLLEQSGSLKGKILQVAGMTVVFDLTKPAGARIVKASVGGAALDAARDYRVATNDFLAAGGDGFTGFTEGRDVVHGDLLSEVLVDYLRNHSPVSYQVDSRISFIR
jgi:5'-nucleotidase / UDP-sugar diphosphatase